MTPRTRHGLAAVAVLAAQAYLYGEYRELGTEYHFWLHLLLGGWVGVGLLALWALAAPRVVERVRPFEAGFLGHAWSAVPDVLFLVAGVLHASWMDVFALHVTAHFLWPGALVAGLALWSLAVLALLLVRLRRPRAAAGALVASLGLLAVGVVLRTPLPATLQEVRDLERSDTSWVFAGADWTCSVAAAPGAADSRP